jgi:nucleoside diphosphate kinase
MYKKIVQEMKKYKGLHYITEEISNYKYELDNLCKYGMVLLGPDSFLQNEALNIIEFFKGKGFELVDISVKRLSRTLTENLFLPTSTCTQCGDLKWWMIQDSAEQGAFCAALFYCSDANIDNHCLKRLNAYKGQSNPLDNCIGVVRYDYEAINVCLNLIHIPDTYGDFFKDTSPFYKIEKIVEIIQDKDRASQHLKNKLFNMKLMLRTGEKYIFELVLYKTKFNIAYLYEDEEQLIEFYKNQYEWFHEENSREKRNKKIKSNIETEMAMLRKLEENLINEMHSENEIEGMYRLLDRMNIIRILKILTSPFMYKKHERDVYAELEGYGLKINEFERLILNTSLIQWKD